MVEIVEELINKNVKENANVLFSNNFVELQAQAIFQKEIARKDISDELIKVYENGDIHIHDLNFWLRPNCLQHPIYKIFKNGLYALGCISKPAKHLDTALSHVLNALSLGQAHMAGGQSIPMFNVWMAPFVRGVSDEELRQCIQQFIFQLNQISPSRGLQTIFASIVLCEEIPEFMKNKEVGYKEGVFGDYEEEFYRFTEVFIDVLNEGDGSGQPFMFPNTILYMTNGDRFSNELKKKIIKNKMNNSNVYFLNGFKYGKVLATSMGCRTYLDDTLTGDIFKDVMGTGNMSYITLNIPRIILKAIREYGFDISEDKLKEFVESETDRLIDIGVRILLARRNRLWKCWEEGWYPFFKNEIYKDENGWYYNLGFTTMTFGIIGISDCEKISGGKFDGLWFVKMIKEKVDELNKFTYSELADKYGVEYNNYGNEEISRWSLIGSPAEGCTYKFKKLDNMEFGDILKKVGIYDRKYYVNSIFVDDSENLNAMEKILYEEKYHKYLNGGIICHIWNAVDGDSVDELKIWDWFMNIMKNTELRYVTISNVICYCSDCSHKWVGSKFDNKCVKCNGDNIRKYAKITGYLSEIDRWNSGKMDEFYNRNNFKIN